jgi:hypothetical protein
MTYVRRFASFLYDFLVGDAWELFVGPIAALILAWVLLQAGVDHAVVGAVLLLSVLLIAATNVTVALRGSA